MRWAAGGQRGSDTPRRRRRSGRRVHLPRGRALVRRRRGALPPRFAVRGVRLAGWCWASRRAVSDNVTSLGLVQTSATSEPTQERKAEPKRGAAGSFPPRLQEAPCRAHAVAHAVGARGACQREEARPLSRANGRGAPRYTGVSGGRGGASQCAASVSVWGQEVAKAGACPPPPLAPLTC